MSDPPLSGIDIICRINKFRINNLFFKQNAISTYKTVMEYRISLYTSKRATRANLCRKNKQLKKKHSNVFKIISKVDYFQLLV